MLLSCATVKVLVMFTSVNFVDLCHSRTLVNLAMNITDKQMDFSR